MSSSVTISAAFLQTLFFFLRGYNASSPGLFQENCGHIIPSANQTNDNSVTSCDTTRNLVCINWKCECLSDYVHDGNCGCKWGLVGYGAKCIRHNRISHLTCDFKKNLTCEYTIHRCLCTINHVRKDDACIPGTGEYNDACDEPEDHEYVLQMLDSTRHRVRRATLKKRALPSPLDYDDLTAKVNYSLLAEYIDLSTVSNRRSLPKAKEKPKQAREEVLKESAPTPTPTEVKCDPSRYSAAGGNDQNTTFSHEKDDLFFTEFGKDKIGCNPEFNLRCQEGKCKCTNEKWFGMFKVEKSNKGKPRACKRSHFYSCVKNDDCVNGNCVEFNETHETTKLCLPKGMTRDAKFSSSSTFQLINVSCLLICQILSIYA